ncbi:lactate dehydrogenase-like 2-hydroxyacid dehydrogenase/phosphoserine aminotransferase [Labrenzia sp. EL_159]|nr:lactate dehydrogenase-like 2-hydroxyacid dehydrogenase/phosphoserine aminotransferase [Labrenzia sp. EL_162]MBG6197715.1 lactate dehydrogenase-like 2-hydroxyacid dehydrogenase/phosphoserine aminotransferase [Labrenzia sp. EL_159]
MSDLAAQREHCIEMTRKGQPARTKNPFFGVGPITDMVLDDAEGRKNTLAFNRWLESTYRKLDDKGNDIGPFTTSEIGRSMHRGYPADAILLDMMHHIHRYFGFPKSNQVAVGLGGGHSGFTVAIMHMMNPNLEGQKLFVDTPKPESDDARAGGFFRQSWGTQILELQQFANNGHADKVVFAGREGTIPSADQLEALNISLFVGVGHETTGATTYTEEEVVSLLAWLDRDPDNRHAMIDATSMLGAMPWSQEVVDAFMSKCCLFTPFQKAIGGISGYFLASFTPTAMQLIEDNQKNPAWAIARQLKLVVPKDAKKPLTGDKTVGLGPFYDPDANKMTGGVINTFSSLAFAETTYGLLRVENMFGPVSVMNRRSAANRQCINDWLAGQSLLEPGVDNAEKRGAAVTLLRINDPGITDPDIHNRIILRSKQLLGYEGLTHPNGWHEPGLDAARYVNAFPGTPGDYRAWIGGIRDTDDIVALLENITYAYYRAKVVVLEEVLAETGTTFEVEATGETTTRKDDPNRAYRILIADLVGLKPGADGQPDPSEVSAHIEARGATFTPGGWDGSNLPAGQHFFYLPDLSTHEELTAACCGNQYDAVIAAATFFPENATFPEGGVRIGAGTGNMTCACWGGGNGTGGSAPLMNTPSFNSRATAQMVMKSLLKVMPDLDVAEMHDRVVKGDFDTGKHLRDYPTEKLEGKRMGVIGYGNIGREVAKLAKAFGMTVTIHARAHHRDWIESEGFVYAATAEEAAAGADVLSPHTGLGAKGADGTFANAGLVGTSVLSRLNDGAVLVNYDRGEVVDTDALAVALASGKVRHAAIDADLFVADDGSLFGPMVPYRPLIESYPDRLELLPHAAADTEHTSRVEGARQAVDQILSAIRYRKVINVKGEVPDGYVGSGVQTVPGVGAVSAGNIARAAEDTEALSKLRETSETLSAIWGAIEATHDPVRRTELIARHGKALTLAANVLQRECDTYGLFGRYED